MDNKKLKPVNVVVGRFQPFTNGHLDMGKQLTKKNGLPVVYIYIRSKSGANSQFSTSLTESYMEDIKKKYSFIEDSFDMPSVFIPVTIMELQKRGYNPVLIGAGEDRAKVYERMVNKMHTVETLPEFKIQELKGRVTSGTKVRQAIENNDEKTFKQNTPAPIHKYFNNLKSELDQRVISEDFKLNEYLESFNVDKELIEKRLSEFGLTTESDIILIESILEFDRTTLEILSEKKKLKFKTKYPVYHKSYTSAIDAVSDYAEDNNYSIDDDEMFRAFGDAFFKPKPGKTYKKSVEVLDSTGEPAGTLHVQIYNRGTDLSTFELNMYGNTLEGLDSFDLIKMNESIKDELDTFVSTKNIKSINLAFKSIFENAKLLSKGKITKNDLDESIAQLSSIIAAKTNLPEVSSDNVTMVNMNDEVEKAVEVLLSTNSPFTYEVFSKYMMRTNFLKKEFLPWLRMQGLSEYQLEMFVDNLLKVAHARYENYFLGHPSRAYINESYNRSDTMVEVPFKFNKALDKLKFNEFTVANVEKLAKKHGVSPEDARKFVAQMYLIKIGEIPEFIDIHK